MTLGLLFWVVYLVALIFGFWTNRSASSVWPMGGTIIGFILIGILGYQAFGAAVHR